MEGVGSRLGRASSRYGPATVFSGPVRKWKKQWVHVCSSSSSTVSYQNNNSSRSNNGNGNNNNAASALLLCRWTPISPNHTADSDKNSVKPEEPPRRKFRYTPIVVLEEQKKEAAEKVDDKAKTRRVHSLTTGTSKDDDAYEKSNTEGASMEEIQAAKKNRLARQDSNISHLNLDLGLKGHDEKHGLDGENKETKLGRVSSGGFSG